MIDQSRRRVFIGELSLLRSLDAQNITLGTDLIMNQALIIAYATWYMNIFIIVYELHQHLSFQISLTSNPLLQDETSNKLHGTIHVWDNFISGRITLASIQLSISYKKTSVSDSIDTCTDIIFK